METVTKSKKITMATVKSFINKNKNRLWVKFDASFDSMTDGLETRDKKWKPAELITDHVEHTFGIRGIWTVGRSRDRFKAYDNGEFIGIEINNCCGYSTIGVRK